jgi:hypothetical protein
MPNGQFPGPLHPPRTIRSRYEYFFYEKHHKGGYSEDGQWLPGMSQQEEFAVFDLADQHDLSNTKGDLFGLHLSQAREVLELGMRGEQVAKFPVTEEGHPWHGYPAWPIMKLDHDEATRKYPPPVEALAKMKRVGLLSEPQRKRLARGKHV